MDCPLRTYNGQVRSGTVRYGQVPKTWNSHSEYPNAVARAVPFTRTKRPVPDTVRSWLPPPPVVVEKMVVHVVPSGEVCTWNAVANAASQLRTTRLMVCEAPRSTRTHCGSLNALDQRVPVLPSTAFAAGNEAFSVEDAVAG